jgi:acyl carrier protein
MEPLDIVDDRSIFQKLRELIADEMGLNVSQVTLESDFVENFGADSLDVVELVMRVEEDFEIEISDEEARPIKTVADALRLIEEKVRESR